MTFSNRKKGRYFRLLPCVVVMGAAVLVFKTTDLVHSAYAQSSERVAAALTRDPVPSNKDYAGTDDDQGSSSSTVEVTNSLSKRRRELDARESQLSTQANMIAAAEARVDAKINQLKQLQAQINGLVAQRDEAQKTQIATLTKAYSTMKAKDAARIFDNLPDAVLVPVAHELKSDVLAQILANMNAENAKALTVKLADRLTLPQTMDKPADPASAVAPAAAPGPQAAAASAKAPVTAEKPAQPKG